MTRARMPLHSAATPNHSQPLERRRDPGNLQRWRGDPLVQVQNRPPLPRPPQAASLVHELVGRDGYRLHTPTTAGAWPAPPGCSASTLAAHIGGASWGTTISALLLAWRRPRPPALEAPPPRLPARGRTRSAFTSTCNRARRRRLPRGWQHVAHRFRGRPHRQRRPSSNASLHALSLRSLISKRGAADRSVRIDAGLAPTVTTICPCDCQTLPPAATTGPPASR